MNMARLQAEVEENRRAPRERVMLTAKLSFNQGAVSADCVVSNISATGARINVSADVVLAQSMRLLVPQREIDVAVRMVWRRGNLVALAFEPDRSPEKVAPAREKSLEEENRKLRALLVQMEARLKQMHEGL